MSKEAVAKAKQIRKQLAKKDMSISIKIAESDLYDWNPSARYVLDTIARLQINDEESYYPEDAPDEFRNTRIGWCWMSQWRIALRVGKSEVQVQRDIQMFEEHGVIEIRSWEDSNHADHNEYRVNEKVVEAHQRPSQTKDVARPSRYKKKRGANKGSFSMTNQPGKNHEITGMDEE